MASSIIPTLGLPVPVTSPVPVITTSLEYVDGRLNSIAPVPLIQSGTIDLATNGQTIVLPTAYASGMQVFVQGTSNKAGVNGFFTIATYGSLSQFQIFYSGDLIYGPIEMYWFAIGA